MINNIMSSTDVLIVILVTFIVTWNIILFYIAFQVISIIRRFKNIIKRLSSLLLELEVAALNTLISIFKF